MVCYPLGVAYGLRLALGAIRVLSGIKPEFYPIASLTLSTLTKAANALGKRVDVQLV